VLNFSEHWFQRHVRLSSAAAVLDCDVAVVVVEGAGVVVLEVELSPPDCTAAGAASAGGGADMMQVK
jgi:hypothetical protein